jgi:hypothetical protein
MRISMMAMMVVCMLEVEVEVEVELEVLIEEGKHGLRVLHFREIVSQLMTMLN